MTVTKVHPLIPSEVEGMRRAQPRRWRAPKFLGFARNWPSTSLRLSGLGLGAIFLLPGCALQPLYGSGESSATVQTLRSVEVAPIDGKAGWLMRNALNDRLRSPRGEAAAYRLEVELDDQISGFGVRRDDAVTRERRTLRARYRLVDAATGTVVLDATAGSDAGIDVVGSEYATVAAENTALERLAQILADQMIARIALFAGRTAPRSAE